MDGRVWALFGCAALAACSRAGGSEPPPSTSTSQAAAPQVATEGKSSKKSPSQRAIQVAAGTSHSCALLDDGRVFCWGAHGHGQLGAPADRICTVEDLLHNAAPPLRVPCRERPVAVSGLEHATQLTAAGDTTCAVVEGGAVKCWGDNHWGLVGDGTTTDRATPTLAAGLTQVVEVRLSTTHACARSSQGEVHCWGTNFYGQLGTPPVVVRPEVAAREGIGAGPVLAPQRVPQLADVTSVAVGASLTCALKRVGDVACFGRFAPGLLGYHTPQPVPALARTTAFALGEGSHCALSQSGAAKCWGGNSKGLLRDGTRENRPAPVSATAIAPIAQLAFAATRACAALRSGELQCWGDSGTNSIDEPRRVALEQQTQSVALGANHACALTKDGAVWCWGDPFYGATGAKADKPYPTSGFWTTPRRVLPR